MSQHTLSSLSQSGTKSAQTKPTTVVSTQHAAIIKVFRDDFDVGGS